MQHFSTLYLTSYIRLMKKGTIKATYLKLLYPVPHLVYEINEERNHSSHVLEVTLPCTSPRI